MGAGVRPDPGSRPDPGARPDPGTRVDSDAIPDSHAIPGLAVLGPGARIGPGAPGPGALPGPSALPGPGGQSSRSSWPARALVALLSVVVLVGLSAFVSQMLSPKASLNSFSGKCVTFTAAPTGHRAIKNKVDCGAYHDGVVLAVVASIDKCPHGTTTTFKPATGSGRLCVHETAH